MKDVHGITRPLQIAIWLPDAAQMAALVFSAASFVLYFLVFYIFRQPPHSPEIFVRFYYIYLSLGLFLALDAASALRSSRDVNPSSPQKVRKSPVTIGASMAMGIIAPGCLAFMLLSLWSWILVGALPPQITVVMLPTPSALGLLWEICDMVFLIGVSLIAVLFLPQFLAIARWFQAYATPLDRKWILVCSKASGLLFLILSVVVLALRTTGGASTPTDASLSIIAGVASGSVGFVLTFARRLLNHAIFLFFFLVLLVGLLCIAFMMPFSGSAWNIYITMGSCAFAGLILPEGIIRYRSIKGLLQLSQH